MRGRMKAVRAAVVLFHAAAAGVLAHCQIPCGIYGDELRVQMMAEDIRTIGKTMNENLAL